MRMPRCAAVILAAVFGISHPLSAQEVRGQILGRVTDPSGAAVARCEVFVKNVATGVEFHTTTNESGDYSAPYLLSGDYSVRVEFAGFKTFVQEGVTVRASEAITINVTLQMGQVSESVRVTGETPLVEAASASLGQVIDSRRITELPLRDGNPVMLASLAPGVLNFSTAGWTTPAAIASATAISSDGSRSGTNEFTMDGGPNTTGSSVAFVPPADVVQEFKIDTAKFDAASGFTPGATVNISTKSGTNELHGEVHHFFRNTVLNANRFFANKAGQPNPASRMNRYGASAGGPVYIPKVYDGRNRTFFMYGFEGFRLADPRGTVTTAVPTSAERAGDFSALLRLGSQYQVYDPATTVPAGSGRFSRSPFPGNIIPSNRIDPTARTLAGFWDAPNLPGGADGSNNWTTPDPLWMHYYANVFRVDHNVSDRTRVYLRGHLARHDQEEQVRFNRAQGDSFYRINRGLALDTVHVFSANFLVNVRYSLARYEATLTPVANGIDLKAAGFSQTFIDQMTAIDPRGVRLPQVSVTGFGDFSTQSFSVGNTDAHSLATNFTRIVREHTLRFGAEGRVYRDNTLSLAGTAGILQFTTAWTNGPLNTAAGAPMSQPLASFLLGLPASGSIAYNASRAAQSSAMGYYVADDWKLSSRLTLNLGVRYEVEFPTTERYNRSISDFDFNATSPIDAQARANYAKSPIPELPASQFQLRGGVLFAGVGGQGRALQQSDTNNIMPRIGLAYTLDPKTVIRAGYGIYFDQIGLTRINVNQAGFSRTTSLLASADNGQTFIANIANPFPGGVELPTGAALGLSTNLGQSLTYFNQKLVAPYSQRWQFGVQRQLSRDSILEVSYVGNRGTKLRTSLAADPIPARYLSTSPTRDQATIDFLSAQFPNPFYPLLPGTSLSGTTVARSQLLRPYPEFTGLTYSSNQGYSWYHSMQTRFERRFARSYTANVAWTWSKAMDGTGYLNETDPSPERVISDQDRTHRVVVSGVWELPFGPGKTFGKSAKGLLGVLAGGWQVQGVFQWQSGAPLGFGNSILIGDLQDIALPRGDRTPERWFNTAVFERSSSKQLANNIRTLPTRFSGIRADGINNWDIAFQKGAKLKERADLRFRAEFLNAFNHTQFAAPGTSPTSSAFGVVSAEGQNPRVVQLSLKVRY